MEGLPPIVRSAPLPTPSAAERSTPAFTAADGSASAESTGAEFKAVLEGLGKQIDRGQRMVDRVLHTSSALEPQQLLALQAGIYRYAEVVDLTTKLVDRSSTAVKTALQQQ